jgi:hypothetical protein
VLNLIVTNRDKFKNLNIPASSGHGHSEE